VPPKTTRPASETPVRGRTQKLFASLGPGLISGAANDDPSCISTFAVAGASFGYLTLWTSVVCLPLVGAVQMMCSRLGMVSGRGLAGAVRVNFPAWVLLLTCGALFLANVVNIGADLGGMAEVTAMVTGISPLVWTPLYAALIVGLLFALSYRQIVRVFKWLTIVLFAYVVTAFLSSADWRSVLANTFIPHIQLSEAYLSVLVGIFGAALSPYLFFWQSSQEVEEEYIRGRVRQREREGASHEELERSKVDVIAGATVSRLITYFITLTTAATLHAHGRTHIQTAQQAAEALKPLAGDAAYWLFAVAFIGTGMLSVPVLAGSSAYAVSEAAAWRASLEQRPRAARGFYFVMTLSVLVGLGLKLSGFNAVAMLFWSAVINGVLAPFLIVLLVLLTSSRAVMGDRANPPVLRIVGWVTAAVTALAATAMLVSFAR
jgi:NRAMP (natural resistance-associated macrophage protein)-like metal ion transporter